MPQYNNPQEKKRKSLERDGRLIYDGNNEASRRGVRRRKRNVNRSSRHAVKRVLSKTHTEPAALVEKMDDVKRIRWKKLANQALGEHLLDKLIDEIIERTTKASGASPAILDNLEAKLMESEIHSLAVRDILKQLRSIARSRWSTSYATPLNIDYETATAIVEILNRSAGDDIS